MKTEDYKSILRILTENISEGVYIVKHDGTGIIYNDRMCQLEQMNARDVLGKNVKVVQSHIPDEESTLVNAIENKKITSNYQQTFINQFGKEITTINTTVPVIDTKGKVIAAIEIARDITTIKEMSDTILDLRSESKNHNRARSNLTKMYTLRSMVGENENFVRILEKCKRASKVSASVLIYGETGTGKELIAQSIHYESDRSAKPFLAQNCAALPENLLEGILFGTTKGGFTGAIDREGLFEQANGGTLLLDEVSAMPYNLQSKLLRTLQENYIRRIGGTKDIPIDVRIIATINEKADDLIAQGKLRQDLYYRLKIIEINLPPLRERAGDILLLVDYFIEKYCKEFKKTITGITDKGKEMLVDYSYPGNVRELEHIIMSAISMADSGDIIDEDQLELPISNMYNKSTVSSEDLNALGIEKYIENIERAIISEVIESSGSSISKAAKILGLKRQTLQYKLKKYNLNIRG